MVRYVMPLLATLVVAACDSPTGPSDDVPLRPTFKLDEHGGRSAGGHARGYSDTCTRPNASVECAVKAALMGLTGGTMAATCPTSPTGAGAVACASLGAGLWSQYQDYRDTPDCRGCDPFPRNTIGPVQPWNRNGGGE